MMRRRHGPPEHDDLVLGEVVSDVPSAPRGRQRRPILCLTPEDQRYHTTIFGRTGAGKSRFLQSLFLQHLTKGHGVCLIDPHHDLSLQTLAYLTERGYFADETLFDRLIYLDWGNGWFVPFNVLATGASPHTGALHTLDAMIRVWPELRRAPAFQTLFLTAMVVLSVNNLPLTALHQFLTDPAFRAQCLTEVTDPLILHSVEGFKKFTGEDTSSAKRRAFLLSFHEHSRLTLGQDTCLLNMRTLMDQGISLIINLGHVEAGTRQLLGALLLVQLEQAALSRANIPEKQRRPYTVLLDEWPSFAKTDETIGTILSETRKFGLRMVLAAQNPAQVSSDALAAALENCRLSIVFQQGRSSAVEHAREIATLDPALPTHPQFEFLTQDIQHLEPQEAWVKVHGGHPVKIETLLVPDPKPSEPALARVLAEYKRRYQRPKEVAERHQAPPAAAHDRHRAYTPVVLFDKQE